MSLDNSATSNWKYSLAYTAAGIAATYGSALGAYRIFLFFNRKETEAPMNSWQATAYKIGKWSSLIIGSGFGILLAIEFEKIFIYDVAKELPENIKLHMLIGSLFKLAAFIPCLSITTHLAEWYRKHNGIS